MDTPEPTAPVPDDPTARMTPTPADAPNPAGHGWEPAAPIALGPVAGAWIPSPNPPPAAPASPPPAAGGSGTWGPIATPHGLAWGPAPIPPVPAPPQRHRNLMALGAVAVVVSLLVGVGVGYAVRRPAGNGSPSAIANGGAPSGSGSGAFTAPTVPSNQGSGSTVPSGVASEVEPGLVDINVSLSYQQESAAGTGQVLTSSGEVLTNNHVIDGATSISAVDVGNGRTYTASVVGYDRTGDLAVIQLHGASGLSTVSTGDSSKVAVGDPVVAIGNAGGMGGTPSVATGTVTTLNQAITASDDNGANSEQLTGLIEVNANVQPGDSGGPLVNSAGKVVGIDTAAAQSNTFSSSGGNGYAIPINQALTIARQIMAGKSSSTVHVGPTAFLGVEVTSSSDLGGLGGFGQSGSSVAGASVAWVASGSPASSAGLSQGDVITSLAGQTVSSPSSLSTIIAGHSPGDSVQMVWVDAAGQQHSARVTLASGPAT